MTTATFTNAHIGFSTKTGNKGLISSWIARSEQRRELANLPTHMLADIGITESERAQELRKGFWQR